MQKKLLKAHRQSPLSPENVTTRQLIHTSFAHETVWNSSMRLHIYKCVMALAAADRERFVGEQFYAAPQRVYPLQELLLRRLQNIMQRALCQTPIEVKMQSSVSCDADYSTNCWWCAAARVCSQCKYLARY